MTTRLLLPATLLLLLALLMPRAAAQPSCPAMPSGDVEPAVVIDEATAVFSHPSVIVPHGPTSGHDFLGNCGDASQDGVDRVVAVRVMERSVVTVEVTVTDFKTSLMVRTDCAPGHAPPSDIVQVACNSHGAADWQGSLVTWTAVPGQWYYVIVDEYGSSAYYDYSYYQPYSGTDPSVEISIEGVSYPTPAAPEPDRYFNAVCAGSDLDNNEITLLLPGPYRDGHVAYPATASFLTLPLPGTTILDNYAVDDNPPLLTLSDPSFGPTDGHLLLNISRDGLNSYTTSTNCYRAMEPSPVPSVTCTVLSATKIRVDWTAPAGPISSYNIRPYHAGTWGTSGTLSFQFTVQGGIYLPAVRANSPGSSNSVYVSALSPCVTTSKPGPATSVKWNVRPESVLVNSTQSEWSIGLLSGSNGYVDSTGDTINITVWDNGVQVAPFTGNMSATTDRGIAHSFGPHVCTEPSTWDVESSGYEVRACSGNLTCASTYVRCFLEPTGMVIIQQPGPVEFAGQVFDVKPELSLVSHDVPGTNWYFPGSLSCRFTMNGGILNTNSYTLSGSAGHLKGKNWGREFPFISRPGVYVINATCTTASQYHVNQYYHTYSASFDPITVYPSATFLHFDVEPAGGSNLAGDVLGVQPVVSILDANLTLITGPDADGLVALSILDAASAPGSMIGEETVAAVNGVATFSGVAINNAGYYRLFASMVSGANVTVGGLSANFSVWQVATGILFSQQPAGGVTENDFLPTSPVFEIIDVDGARVATGPHATLTIDVDSSPPGSLFGTPTSFATTAGVAAVGPGTLYLTDARADWRINATVATLGLSTLSLPFEIFLQCVALVFDTEPQDVREHDNLAVAPVVTAMDRFGGVITTGPDSALALGWTITIGSGSGTLNCSGAVSVASPGHYEFPPCAIDGAAGTHTVDVTNVLFGIPSVSSAAFVVHGYVVGVVILTPAIGDVLEGDDLSQQPLLGLVDARGSAVSSGSDASLPVTVLLSTSTFVVPAAATVNAVSGTVSFANLAIVDSGSVVLTFDAMRGSTTSGAAIDIFQRATSLAFLTEPVGDVLTDVALFTQPAVDILDKNAALITTGSHATLTVTFSMAVIGSVGSMSGGGDIAAAGGVASTASSPISFSRAATTVRVFAEIASLAISATSMPCIIYATAAELVFSREPVGFVLTAELLSVQPEVTVLDSFGDVIATGPHSSIGVSLDVSDGSLSGTTTDTTSAGVASLFSVSVTGAMGSVIVLGVSTTTPVTLPSVNAASVVIYGLAEAMSVLVPPVADVLEDDPLSVMPTFRLLDMYGQPLTAGPDATLNVTVSSATPLAGTLVKPCVAGDASFTDLVFLDSGIQSLTASALARSGVLVTVTNLDVHARAESLSVVQQPLGFVLPNQGLSQEPVISILDINGAVVATGPHASLVVDLDVAPFTFTAGTASVSAFGGAAIGFSGLAVSAAGLAIIIRASTAAPALAVAAAPIVIYEEATHLVVETQPIGNVLPSNALATPPTFSIRNATGDIVTAGPHAALTVSLTASGGPGTLGGALTESANLGLVTFPGLSLSMASVSYRLTAETTTTFSLQTINVTSDALVIFQEATSLRFNPDPIGDVSRFTPIAQVPAVEIVDLNGQVVVEGPHSNINVSLSLGGASFGEYMTGTTLSTSTFGLAANFSNLQVSENGTFFLTATTVPLPSQPLLSVDSAQFEIALRANNAPTITFPAANNNAVPTNDPRYAAYAQNGTHAFVSMAEDGTYRLSDIVIADVDVDDYWGGGLLRIRLATDGVAELTLSPLIVGAIASFAEGDGTSDTAMDFLCSSATAAIVLDQLMISTPPLWKGTEHISIIVDDQGSTGSGGVQTARAQIIVQVLPVPTIFSVDKSASWGSTVTIRGDDFGTANSVLSVTIAGQDCDDAVWLSETEIRCRPPPGLGKNLPVFVQVDGKDSTNSPEIFSYYYLEATTGNDITVPVASAAVTVSGFVTLNTTEEIDFIELVPVSGETSPRIFAVPPTLQLSFSNNNGNALNNATGAMLTFQGSIDHAGEERFRVRVTFSDGELSTDTSPFDMSFVLRVSHPDAPIVASLSPARGGYCGGEKVIVSGSDLGSRPVNLTYLAIGGVPCAKISWRSRTLVECTTGSGMTANSTVVKTTSGTFSTDTLWDVSPAPIITSVHPTSVVAKVPTLVEIRGFHLGTSQLDVAELMLAGMRCTDVAWGDETSVNCTSPVFDNQVALAEDGEPPAQSGHVSMTTRSGCAGPAFGSFSFLTPEVTGVSPNLGSVVGGFEVTITGVNLPASVSELMQNVTVAGVPCLDPTIVRPTTEMTCVVAEGQWANRTIAATNGASPNLLGVVSLVTNTSGATRDVQPMSSVPDAQLFRFLGDPWIASFSPMAGPERGGDSVTIVGEFLGESQADLHSVSIAGTPCNSTMWMNATRVVCRRGRSSAQLGPVTIDVAHVGSVVSEELFSVQSPLNPAPIVRTVSPSTVSPTETTAVTLSGDSLARSWVDLASVELVWSGSGGAVASAPCALLPGGSSFVSLSEISCLAPPLHSFSTETAGDAKPGEGEAIDIVVTSHLGGAGFSTATLSYVYPPPSLTSLFPKVGRRAGGDRITLRGRGFRPVAWPTDVDIFIGSTLCTESIRLSETVVVCVTPAESAVTPTEQGGRRFHAIVDGKQSPAVDLGFAYVDESDFCDPPCGEFGVCNRGGQCACTAGWSSPPLCDQEALVAAVRTADSSEDGTLTAKLALDFLVAPITSVSIKLEVSDESEASFEPNVAKRGPLFEKSGTRTVTFGVGTTGVQLVSLYGVPDWKRDGDVPFSVSGKVTSSDSQFSSFDFAVSGFSNTESGPVVNTITPATSPINGTNVTLSGEHFDPAFTVRVDDVECAIVDVIAEDIPDTNVLRLQQAGQSDDLGYIRQVVVTTPSFFGQENSRYRSITIKNAGGTELHLHNGLYFTDDCPDEGYWGRGADCALCPEGAVCPGGYRIWPKSGFWNSGEESGFVEECSPPERCTGGPEAGCAIGYEGDMCGACSSGYKPGAENTCVPCPTNDGIMIYFLADCILWTGFGISAVLIHDRMTFSYFVVIVRALQMLSGIGSMASRDVPLWVRDIYDFLHLFSGDYSFLSPDCIQPTPFATKYFAGIVYNLCLFIPMFAMLVMSYVVAPRWVLHVQKDTQEAAQKWRKFYQDRAIRCVPVMLTVLYLSISVRSMQVLRCEKVNDKFVVFVRQDTECFVGSHLTATIVAVLLLLAHSIAFPIAAQIFFSRNTDKLWTDETFRERWDFLYELQRPGYHWFFLSEFIILFWLAMGTTVMVEDPLMQACIVTIALVAKFLFIAIRRPFEEASQDWLQGFLAIASLIAVNLNLITSLGLLSNAREISTGLIVVVFVIFGLALIGLIVYVTYLITFKKKIVEPEGLALAGTNFDDPASVRKLADGSLVGNVDGVEMALDEAGVYTITDGGIVQLLRESVRAGVDSVAEGDVVGTAPFPANCDQTLLTLPTERLESVVDGTRIFQLLVAEIDDALDAELGDVEGNDEHAAEMEDARALGEYTAAAEAASLVKRCRVLLHHQRQQSRSQAVVDNEPAHGNEDDDDDDESVLTRMVSGTALLWKSFLDHDLIIGKDDNKDDAALSLGSLQDGEWDWSSDSELSTKIRLRSRDPPPSFVLAPVGASAELQPEDDVAQSDEDEAEIELELAASEIEP